jgi:cellulose synthase/poly-beta-1,6-N-acetylglucosamine synthase-like glycosyltransferase
VTLVLSIVLVSAAIQAAYLLWLRCAPEGAANGRPRIAAHDDANASPDWPRVDIFVPVLDEESFIAQKLDNLQRLAYPRQLLTITVLDGGSRDHTVALVEHAAAAAALTGQTRVDLVDTVPPGTSRVRGKAEQVNAGLARAQADFILFTDADSRLEPDALTRLIAAFRSDDTLGVVGARVSPAAGDAHPAEHLHWRLLNWLHRQEARRGSAAIVTGPCYLLRRGVIARIPGGVVADDVFVSCAAAAEGFTVGWVDTIVTELRAPRSAREMLQYRRRRGAAYLREVLRFLPRVPRMAPPARGIFLWRAALLFSVPFGGAALAVLGALIVAPFTTRSSAARTFGAGAEVQNKEAIR